MGRQAEKKMEREAERWSWLKGEYKVEPRTTKEKKTLLVLKAKYAFSMLFLLGPYRLCGDTCSYL